VPVLTQAPIGVEVLDSPGADPALVRRMLADIACANRWLGGVSALRVGLRFLLGTAPRSMPLTLLDVGTGAGDLPLAAQRWARKRGIALHSVGVERHRAAAQLSNENGVPCVVACGSALPFRTPIHHSPASPPCGTGQALSQSVDIVLISQLLHHFDDDAATTLIREAVAVARHGVILTDLRPMAGAALGFQLAGWALRFHPTTVSDGIVSVSRGRTAHMLGQLACRAGAVAPLVRDLGRARVVVAFRTDR
jgi:hypothetical protein